MKRMVLLLPVVLAVASARPLQPMATGSRMPHSAETPTTRAELQALASLEPIDTHTHVARGAPGFYAMLDRLHMHIVDILVFDSHDSYRKSLQPQLQDALQVVRDSKGHAVLCTTFDPYKFGQPDFPESAIKGLNRDFVNGAVAVKIWKNVGMDLKDKNGQYILPDNPAFEPIFKDIQAHNHTLIAHLAEPDEAWQPLNPNGLDYSYYKENPIWYMYGKPDVPSKQQILDARDHMLARNPKLRVVGAHLGSLEDNLGQLAKDFDRYPNFAVDTAARVIHLAVMPKDEVRAFILKYQDRILYGTDMRFAKNENPQDAIQEWQDQYLRDWRYFATSDSFEYSGRRTQGLGLPSSVLRKLFHDNAVHWIPGVIAGK